MIKGKTKSQMWALFGDHGTNNPVDFRISPLYHLKNLVDDLEPYSLYPREELVRLMKLAFFTILNKVKEGYRVTIPNFGSFYNAKRTGGKYNHVKTYQEERVPVSGRAIRYKPSPFATWYLDPGLTVFNRSDKIGHYFNIADQYMEELYKTDHGFINNIPDRSFEKFIPKWVTKTPVRKNSFISLRGIIQSA